MKKRKQTCFRDEIRKSLIFHALAPCFISLVVLLLVFTAVGSQQIIRKSRTMLEHFSGEFEGVIDSYVDENKRMAGELDVEQFKGLSSYKTEAVSEIYRFLNGQVYRVTITCLTGTGIWFFHQQPVQCHTVHRKLSALEHNGPE